MTLALSQIDKLMLARLAAHSTQRPSWVTGPAALGLADALRTSAPGLDDETLAVLMLRTGGYVMGQVIDHDLHGTSAARIILGSAYNLAALELGELP